MLKYNGLTKRQEKEMIDATRKMLDIGLWPTEIAEILKQPIDLVQGWVTQVKAERINRN